MQYIAPARLPRLQKIEISPDPERILWVPQLAAKLSKKFIFVHSVEDKMHHARSAVLEAINLLKHTTQNGFLGLQLEIGQPYKYISLSGAKPEIGIRVTQAT